MFECRTCTADVNVSETAEGISDAYCCNPKEVEISCRSICCVTAEKHYEVGRLMSTSKAGMEARRNSFILQFTVDGEPTTSLGAACRSAV
jgi:hypothetical protein